MSIEEYWGCVKMFVKIVSSDKVVHIVNTDYIRHFVLTMSGSKDNPNPNGDNWWYGLMIDLTNGCSLFPDFRTQQMSYDVYDKLIELKSHDKPDMITIGDIEGGDAECISK